MTSRTISDAMADYDGTSRESRPDCHRPGREPLFYRSLLTARTIEFACPIILDERRRIQTHFHVLSFVTSKFENPTSRRVAISSKWSRSGQLLRPYRAPLGERPEQKSEPRRNLRLEQLLLALWPMASPGHREAYNTSMATASYLDRLLEPLTEAFTPRMASVLLELRADSELEAHIGELRLKANSGTLTPAEEASIRISLRPSI
jgi:hypothetical protein